MARFKGYYNKETGTVDWFTHEQIADYLAKARNNPKAPMIIQDTIPATRHHAACCTTESRSQFERLCKATGTTVRDKPVEFNDSTARSLSKDVIDSVKADIEQATLRAANDLKWGQVKIDEKKAQLAKAINEQFKSKGIDTKLPNFN